MEGTSPLGFQATDHSWRLYINICKRHTTGYFKDTLGQFLAVFVVTEQSGFTETSWHVQNALCWPNQIFIVKTWSFPNPIPGVFVPKSDQTVRTALSQHKSGVCKNLNCEHLLSIGVLDYFTGFATGMTLMSVNSLSLYSFVIIFWHGTGNKADQGWSGVTEGRVDHAHSNHTTNMKFSFDRRINRIQKNNWIPHMLDHILGIFIVLSYLHLCSCFVDAHSDHLFRSDHSHDCE